LLFVIVVFDFINDGGQQSFRIKALNAFSSCRFKLLNKKMLINELTKQLKVLFTVIFCSQMEVFAQNTQEKAKRFHFKNSHLFLGKFASQDGEA
jgi:hypothetical protein